jgi:putative Holliday junction resolvase
MPHTTVRVLGFDFGMKYIGVAVGQTITKSANPVGIVRATDGIPDWQQISQLITHWQPDTLIVGKPLNMDDSMQHITFCALKFARRLENKYKLPVHLVDERLSTWEAKQLQKSKKINATAIAEINATAAALLVEQWLQDQK